MKTLFLLTAIIVFVFKYSCAQSVFSLQEYLNQRENVKKFISLRVPSDMEVIEDKVHDLINNNHISFPNIYTSNLQHDSTQYAYFADTVKWNVYYSYIAFSIYLDFSNRIPWKLSEYNSIEMDLLFDKRHFFTDWPANSFRYESTPTNPMNTYLFLINNNLIGRNKTETIKRVLEWSRYLLVHYTGTGSALNLYNHWQFNGGPPVERVINGTTRLDDQRFFHYTKGCGGTSYFLRNVLQICNIPIACRQYPSTHYYIYFPTEGTQLAHSDDPYGVVDEFNEIEIPIHEIVISLKELDSLKSNGFGENDIAGYNAGKLVVKYLPLFLYSNDTSYMYQEFAKYLNMLKVPANSQRYNEIMHRAHIRYGSVKENEFLALYNIRWSDSLWYKKIYKLNSAAEIDTVLIPYDKGIAKVYKDTIYFSFTNYTNQVIPDIFRSENSSISLVSGSVLKFDSINRIEVISEDSLTHRYYYIKGNVELPDETNDKPKENASLLVYPNPVFESSVIRYRITNTSHVRLSLFDMTGKEVKILKICTQTPGDYCFPWKKSDLNSGIYLLRLIKTNFEGKITTETCKIELIE